MGSGDAASAIAVVVADNGNRTHIICLEGREFTINIYPHKKIGGNVNRERRGSLLFCFNGTFLSLPLLRYPSFFRVDTDKIYEISIIVYRGGFAPRKRY